MTKIQSVHLVPTYACNLACPYCYAAKYRKKYPQMSWKRFTETIDLLIKNDVQSITFIGGEPTVWPHLDRAITVCRDLGMAASLLSNGIRHGEIPPHAVTINGNNLADEKLRAKIIESLKWYRENGVRIGLRFNLASTTSEKLLKQYIGWAKQYADSVSFAPIVPYQLERELGKVLYRFAKMLTAKKISATLNRAVPLCIFSPTELAYLRQHCKLYSRCYPATRSVVINPNGSLLPCVDLNLPQKFRKDFHTTIQDCSLSVAKIKNKAPVFQQCADCKYLQVACQGGCLTVKV